jgi:hypothetical protein
LVKGIAKSERRTSSIFMELHLFTLSADYMADGEVRCSFHRIS